MRGESDCGPYGDFIQDLDKSIERICHALKKMDMYDNTVIIVTSDNGGDIPIQQERPECVAMSMGLEINGALRGDKHTIWEGGVRVPFVVRWPKKFVAGTTSSSMINLIDVFATVVDILGGELPSDGSVAPDSISFYQTLLHPHGKSDLRRTEMVVTNAQGIFAIRQGPWKYIEGELPATWKGNRNSNYQGQALRQLYHIENDLNEQKNAIELYPEIAEKMQQALNAIRQ